MEQATNQLVQDFFHQQNCITSLSVRAFKNLFHPALILIPNLVVSIPYIHSIRAAARFSIYPIHHILISINGYLVVVSTPSIYIWATDEITCLGKMPSTNVGGPLSVLQVLKMDHAVSVLGGRPYRLRRFPEPLVGSTLQWHMSQGLNSSYRGWPSHL